MYITKLLVYMYFRSRYKEKSKIKEKHSTLKFNKHVSAGAFAICSEEQSVRQDINSDKLQ